MLLLRLFLEHARIVARAKVRERESNYLARQGADELSLKAASTVLK